MKRLSPNTKRFLCWLAIIIAGVIFIDASLGIVNRYMMKDGSVRTDAIEHLILDADEDIIILGNSAAACHFNAARMEESLGIACYNGGTMGASLKFNLLVLKGLISHHHPRLIILALNPANFSDNSLGKTTVSFPLYYGKAGVDFDRAIDSIYPYRSKLLRMNIIRADRNLFRRFAYKSGLVNYPLEKGYQPLPPREHPVKFRTVRDTVVQPNPLTLHDLEEFISITRKYHIPLILTLTPNCISGTENDLIIRHLQRYEDGETVIFRNDTRLFPITKSTDMFYDLLHLNERGANIYTDTISRLVSTLMQ